MMIYTTTKITDFFGIEIRTDKNSLGWSGYSRGYATRPYAVSVAGKLLRTKSGAVRTFGDRDAAREAGEIEAAARIVKAGVA